MKRVKRILGISLLLAALISCLVLTASATETTTPTVVASGTCGGNLTWTLDSDGVLSIEGSGAMDDYSSRTYYLASYTTDYYCRRTTAPWYNHASKIKSVSIGANVTSIGSYAFYHEIVNAGWQEADYMFDKLKTITIKGKLRTIGDFAFYDSALTAIALPDTTISIGNSAFCSCNSLREVTMGNRLATIEQDAFYGCIGLKTVTFGSGLTSIYPRAFYNCSSLKEAVLPDRVTYMGTSVFYGCSTLETASIPVGIKYLPASTFNGCSGLKNVTLPEGMTAIDNSAFYQCYGLPAITLPSTLTIVGAKAFYACDSLTEVTIPDSVATIGTDAFGSCDMLERITVGDGVTSTENVFDDCMSLTEVVVGSNVTTLVFSNCISLLDIYFEGNAPASFGGFNSYTYLYYIPGNTGWTDSDAYDAEAGTWNGYQLAVWEEMVQPEEPSVLEGTLAAIEVSMDSELLLWQKFELPAELINDDDAYAIVTAEKKGGLKETIIPMTEIRAAGADKNGRYIIEQGMAAPEMGRSVSVCFVDGNGNYVNLTDYATGEVATSVSRTITDYSKLALEKGSTAQKNLNCALLAYGGYAQAYFNVDVDAPVYNVLIEMGKEVPNIAAISGSSISQEMTSDGNLVTPTTQQAFLDSAIFHRVYFTLNSGVSIDDLSFELTKRNKAGEYTETAQPVYESDKDRYYIQIDGIASPLLDYMYDLEIVDSSGNIQNVTTSVAAYLKLGISKSANVKQINMFKAMYYYNQIANDFFGF